MYLTGCVIPCGVPDSDNDILTAKDIKIIFAKYLQRLTDIDHNDISYYGIEVLANWISETDTIIAGRTVPAKSWLATVKVMNPEIIDLVKRGELRGFSLSSTYVGEVDKKTDERVSYSDLQSSEEIIPIRISLVKKPANGFAFEEADYETFINKSKEARMSEESKFSLGDLKNIFKFKSDLEETIIEKQAPEEGNAGADEAEKSVDALFEKVDMLLEKVSAIEEGLKRIEESKSDEEADKEEKADEEKIEKAEEEADKEEEAEEEVDKKEGAEEADKEEAEEADKKEEADKEEADKKEEEKIEKSDDECEDDKKIDKSAEEPDTKKINKGITTKAHDVPEAPVEKPSTFYNRTKRDHLGRKIRQ